MSRKLNPRSVDSIKPTPGARTAYPDGTVPGLALRVTGTTVKSIKTWTLVYRGADRRQRRVTLGRYPALGLAEARKRATTLLRDVDHGHDPAAEKRAARVAARARRAAAAARRNAAAATATNPLSKRQRGAMTNSRAAITSVLLSDTPPIEPLGDTITDLAWTYIHKYAQKKKRSWQDDLRMLAAEVLPLWGHRRARDIARRDVRDLVEAIADRGSPITANRCLALVRKMFNFAITRDWLEGNVASLIDKPGEERSRDRVLDDDEIRLVWKACETERIEMCALTRLRLVTGQRGGELAKLKWSDLDGDWFTIPAAIAKNKRAHRVPISTLAKSILDGLSKVDGCDYIFPGRSGNRPLGDEKKGAARIGLQVLAVLRANDPTVKTFDFQGHDLRRTVGTRLGSAGVTRDNIARVLNHVESGPRATQTYDRYTYDREKRLALDGWARTLMSIIEQKPTTNVVPIAAMRG